MDLRKIKASAEFNLHNMQGWRTNRRIIVIESDDWGSVRMPSKSVYDKMLDSGIRVDKCPYNSFDSIESEDDLASLFDVLSIFNDFKGSNPVITANFVMANPDFKKIETSGFREYYFELFTETYKNYSKNNNNNTYRILNQGIEERLVYPQFHGREHLNVNRWMKALQQNLPETRFAFENNLFGISTTITKENRRSYLAAFDFDNESELEDHKKIIVEGLDIFQKIFGYKSQSFIASNYIWQSELEETLAENGVNYIQGIFNQIEPSGYGRPSKLIPKRLGRLNNSGQIYLIRNAFFEPSLQSNIDPVSACMSDISVAFRWNKPAIISSHRVNYISRIAKGNRDNNLVLLNKLLKEITHRWNKIEFMNSVELGATIRSDIVG